MAKRFLSLEDAAVQFGVPVREIEQLVEQGTLKALPDRGSVKFRIEDLEAHFATNPVTSAASDDDDFDWAELSDTTPAADGAGWPDEIMAEQVVEDEGPVSTDMPTFVDDANEVVLPFAADETADLMEGIELPQVEVPLGDMAPLGELPSLEMPELEAGQVDAAATADSSATDDENDWSWLGETDEAAVDLDALASTSGIHLEAPDSPLNPPSGIQAHVLASESDGGGSSEPVDSAPASGSHVLDDTGDPMDLLTAQDSGILLSAVDSGLGLSSGASGILLSAEDSQVQLAFNDNVRLETPSDVEIPTAMSAASVESMSPTDSSLILNIPAASEAAEGVEPELESTADVGADELGSSEVVLFVPDSQAEMPVADEETLTPAVAEAAASATSSPAFDEDDFFEDLAAEVAESSSSTSMQSLSDLGLSDSANNESTSMQEVPELPVEFGSTESADFELADASLIPPELPSSHSTTMQNLEGIAGAGLVAGAAALFGGAMSQNDSSRSTSLQKREDLPIDNSASTMMQKVDEIDFDNVDFHLDEGSSSSTDSGIQLGTEDSGIALTTGDSGIALMADDSGFTLAGADDSGISLAEMGVSEKGVGTDPDVPMLGESGLIEPSDAEVENLTEELSGDELDFDLLGSADDENAPGVLMLDDVAETDLEDQKFVKREKKKKVVVPEEVEELEVEEEIEEAVLPEEEEEEEEELEIDQETFEPEESESLATVAAMPVANPIPYGQWDVASFSLVTAASAIVGVNGWIAWEAVSTMWTGAEPSALVAMIVNMVG